MKNITILGSTGSIGVNTLEVLKEYKNYNVLAISANKNIKLLRKQIEEFKPSYVSLGIKEEIIKLKKQFKNIKFYHNDEGLKKISTLEENDLVLSAIVGFEGFFPTYYALMANKKVALANKESLVVGAMFLKDKIKNIISIDSEHAAINQILKNRNYFDIEKIILTASGGPFWSRDSSSFKDIELKEALNHPNWKMGNKITVDSSTMMNKTFEIIEAHYLFNLNYEKIDFIIHPQSIIHSMVEFKDNTTLAQMAISDMKIPISQALYENIENKYKSINFRELKKLEFFELDSNKFPLINLAKEVIQNPHKGIVLNSVNDFVVDLFLNKKIKWYEISKIIQNIFYKYPLEKLPSLEKLKDVDMDIKKFTSNYYNLI